jgi:hypothetical protein
MAVFDGIPSTPRQLPADEVARLLRWAADQVERGGSMEGSVMWGWSDRPGYYDFGGIARYGNDQGQGGMALFWDTSSS